MSVAAKNHFLDSIHQLRAQEEMVIFSRYVPVTPAEEKPVADFLQQEYARERLEWPESDPGFSGEAALWGAKMVYMAAQFLLYRDKTGDEMAQILRLYPGRVTAIEMVSADLCLRFLPDLLVTAQKIDPEDPLIPILEGQLRQWHFSAVGYPFDPGSLDWQIVTGHEWLRDRYIDRVIEKRALKLAGMPVLQTGIKAAIGDHGTFYWKEYVDHYESDQ